MDANYHSNLDVGISNSIFLKKFQLRCPLYYLNSEEHPSITNTWKKMQTLRSMIKLMSQIDPRIGTLNPCNCNGFSNPSCGTCSKIL